MGLPPIGVKAVVEGAASYQRDLTAISNATTKASKSIGGIASSPAFKAFGGALSVVSSQLGGFASGLQGVISQATGAADSVGGLFSELPAGQAALGGVALAATAAATAFVALGLRGAELKGLADSFDRLTASVGIANEALLRDLRAAAKGAVRDFDLIRQANIALSGATGEFGRQFGTALPQILRIAQAQANATGQDITFLF